MSDFSDFIVYADESGDHGMVSINSEFPVFALSFCVIRKDEYIRKVVPAVQQFKFDIWAMTRLFCMNKKSAKLSAILVSYAPIMLCAHVSTTN